MILSRTRRPRTKPQRPISRWLAALLLAAVTTPAAQPWHDPLYLANHGCWPQRVAITLHNAATEPIAGAPVEVLVPALAGARVESVRVCRSDGVELLFDVREAHGRSRRTGALAATDRIILPAECPAQGSATVFVYAGNNAAWPVPDFLPGGFANGSFESGDHAPDGWEPALSDATHVLTWEKSGGRQGSRCVKAEVTAGAPATWVQWQQGGFPIMPGRTYELRAWVRGQDVVGSAGWYVHVNGQQPQLVNRTLQAGEGTFDWKQISVQFIAPSNAQTGVIGTVLHGTGRAWFDDAEFVELGGRPSLRVVVGELERLTLERGDVEKIHFGPDWANRCEVRVRNVAEQPVQGALVRLDLHPAFARLAGVPRDGTVQVLLAGGREATVYQLTQTGDCLFTADLPPRSERLFHAGFSASARSGAARALADYQRLLDSSANLVPNGSFEQGGGTPESWLKPEGGGANGVTAGVSADARFGQRGIEFTVPAGAKVDWIGWHSPPIPVRPGATYLLSGWLKAIGLQSTATLHGHFHDGSGALTKSGAMVGTHPNVSADSDWTQSVAFLSAPPDAATLRLHLTMNTQGTLRHDGILLCQVLNGTIERVHTAAGDAPPPGVPLQVWSVNPLVKVFPDTPPQAQAQAASVELARYEHEPLQLAVRGRFGEAMAKVQATVSTLSNADGATLPAVKVERVGFVPVDYPSAYYSTDVPEWCRKVPKGGGATDGWAGEWPDPLIPGQAFALDANRTQPLWLTVHAPRDAKPDIYRGEIALQADGAPAVVLPLTVRVLPFALPEKTRLKVLFDFRRGPGGWHGASADAPAERRKWIRFMAEHRLGLDQIEPPPQFRYRDGKVSMDTTGFDETARLCFDELGMNVSYTPSFFYMFGWAYPPKKFFGLEPFSPEWTAAVQQAYKLFSDHVRAKGWHDKFVCYISDEPHFQHDYVVEQMKRLCALLHAVDPEMPIYSSTWRFCPAWGESLDLWGVGQYGCFPVADMERVRKAGKRLWFTCDGQQATDTPFLATERMLPYYCFKYGVDGFEFWGLSWWTYDPWKIGWHSFIRQSDEGQRHYWVRYPDGDGFLAYPGAAVGVDGPVSTIRLEQVREGLEDYEAMAMLAELAEKAKAAGQAAPAADRALNLARELVTIPNAGGLRSTEILPDPDRIPAIRRAVNAALVEWAR